MALNRTITSLLSMVENADDLITENMSIFLRGSCNSSNTDIMLKIEVHLRHALSELSKVMNRWKTINRLPYEVLVRVFEFVGRGVPIVQIARVCRHWRQLTLRTPSLWSVYRFPDDEKWAGILWNRSRRFPLDVEAVTNSDTKTPEISLQWIPVHLLCRKLRAFSLVLDIDEEKVDNYMMHIHHIFSFAAPYLTKLSLIDLSWALGGNIHKDFSRIFDGIMPNLKSLTLHRIPGAAPYIRPGLQTLILSCVYVGDLINFLHTLASPSDLTTLSLERLGYSLPHTGTDNMNSDSDESDKFDTTQHCVELARLRVLRIAGCPDHCRCFEQCLLTLPDCSRFYDTLDMLDSTTLPVDSRVDQPILHLQNFSALSLGLDGKRLTASTSNNKRYIRYNLFAPYVSTVMDDHSIAGLTPDGLPLDPFLLKLAPIISFIVTATYRGSLEGWTSVFDQMPCLEFLCIQPTGCSCEDFILSALSPLNPDSTSPCRAPVLKTIWIQNDLADPQSPTTLAMMQLLENRFACGRPIQNLTIQHSASERSVMARIRPFVGAIELYESGLIAKHPPPKEYLELSEQLIWEKDKW